MKKNIKKFNTMRKIIILYLLIFISFCGCKSINVGGNAQAGTVSGSGQITVSLPQEN